MASDDVQVAVSGTIDREDRCVVCGEPMLFRGGAESSIPTAWLPDVKFCGHLGCPAWLMEIPCD